MIPVYNGADYLSQAIDSALAQTWPNTEVIVVDDGSDDVGRTAAIAADYGSRIRYHHKPNGGVATAINRGISLMRGDYFSWLSHDDVFRPSKIEQMMTAVQGRAEPVLAFGDYALSNAHGELIGEYRTGEGFETRQPLWAVFESRINGCALLVDKRCFERCGYLDPRLPNTQDYDLWFRMALAGIPFLHVAGIMTVNRKHAQQGSASPRFLDEAALLWLSMFDRLTPEAIRKHAPSELDFYIRAFRCTPNVPALRDNVLGRIRKLVNAPVTAVFYARCPASHYAQVLPNVAASGLNLVGVVAESTANQDWDCISLERPDGLRTEFRLVVAPPDNDLIKTLQRTQEFVRGEFLWLTYGSVPVASTAVLRSMQLMMATPGAAACLLSRDGAASGSALQDAVIRTAALRRATSQCTGTVTSFVHALSRFGAILTNPAEPPQTGLVESKIVSADEQETPTPISRLTRITQLFNRSPAIARGAVWITWKLSGADATDRLLRWHGIQGWFEEDWYRARYDDVARSGMPPAVHYLMFGFRERRDPSPYFSTAEYLAENPDVGKLGVHPLQHYVIWGQHEGRRAGLSAAATTLAMRGPSVALILDAGDSASVRFAHDLGRQVASRLPVVFIRSVGNGLFRFGLDDTGHRGNTFSAQGTLDAVRAETDRLDVREVLLLSGADSTGRVESLLSGLGRPFDMIHLNRKMAQSDSPCDDRESSDCSRQWLLSNARRHFACNRDIAARLSQSGVLHDIIVGAPPDPDRLRTFRVWARPTFPDEPLRIAVFSDILTESGHRSLLDVLKRVSEADLPLRFLVFAEPNLSLPGEYSGLLRVVTGSGDANLVSQSVWRWNPHVAWFPDEVADAYSYAMMDAVGNGLPVLAVATPQSVEWLTQRPLSWLMPSTSGADDWIAMFLRLHRSGMRNAGISPSIDAALADDHSFYRQYLYKEVFSDKS